MSRHNVMALVVLVPQWAGWMLLFALLWAVRARLEIPSLNPGWQNASVGQPHYFLC